VYLTELDGGPDANKKEQREMADHKIRIDNTGKIVNDDRSVKVKKKDQDQVTWDSQGNSGPWKIVFPPGPPPYKGSPFPSPTFTVPRQGSVSSGQSNVPPSTASYKYEVRDGNDRITDDPDILIDE
jgi:hypothetical protein